MTFKVPEECRIKYGVMKSESRYGNNGTFVITLTNGDRNYIVKVIASDEDGWEHVSVSHKTLIPKWSWMCLVKNLFWDENDTVMQLYPPEGERIDDPPYCLHLWRPIDSTIPIPPTYKVRYKDHNTK